MSFVDEVKNAVTPRAALLVFGVLALQLLFITSYVGALHHPKPEDIKIAVVGPERLTAPVADRLGSLPGSPLDPRTLTDERIARDQMLNREVDAALVLDPRSTTDTLMTASGQGVSETEAIVRILTEAEAQQQRTLRLDDVAPVARGDAGGLTSFYLVVGWCVGGYLCAAVLAISAGARPADRRRAAIRLLVMAVYAVVAGLLGTLIAGPVLDALPGSIGSLWGLGALTVFAVGAATLALQSVFGVVGIGLAILLVVIAGNPSAGGAYPPPLLPEFWRTIGPFLPPGAATWTARSVAYFRGNSVAGPTLVLALWAAAGTIITMIFSSFRRRDEIDALLRRGGTPLPVAPPNAPDNASYVRTERLSEG